MIQDTEPHYHTNAPNREMDSVSVSISKLQEQASITREMLQHLEKISARIAGPLDSVKGEVGGPRPDESSMKEMLSQLANDSNKNIQNLERLLSHLEQNL